MEEDGGRRRAKPKISYLHIVVAARVPIHTERVSGGGVDDDDHDALVRGTPRRRAHPCRHPRSSPPHQPPGFDPASSETVLSSMEKRSMDRRKQWPTRVLTDVGIFFSLANALHIIYLTHFVFVNYKTTLIFKKVFFF